MSKLSYQEQILEKYQTEILPSQRHPTLSLIEVTQDCFAIARLEKEIERGDLLMYQATEKRQKIQTILDKYGIER